MHFVALNLEFEIAKLFHVKAQRPPYSGACHILINHWAEKVVLCRSHGPRYSCWWQKYFPFFAALSHIIHFIMRFICRHIAYEISNIIAVIVCECIFLQRISVWRTARRRPFASSLLPAVPSIYKFHCNYFFFSRSIPSCWANIAIESKTRFSVSFDDAIRALRLR